MTTIANTVAAAGSALRAADVPGLQASAPEFAREVLHAFAGREVPPFEVFLPRGAASVDATKGLVLAVHGGGWLWNGAATLPSMHADIARWLDRGFAAVNVDYRQYGDSRADATAFHDAVRAWAGPDALVGALGGSAGGHLALMTAVDRPDVAFVVSIAGPTDLAHLGGTKDADFVLDLARQSFGDRMAAESPVTHAAALQADVLLAAARDDQVVPASQVDRYLAAGPPHAEGLLLAPGEHQFMHANVSEPDFARFEAAEQRLADRVLAAHAARTAPTIAD